MSHTIHWSNHTKEHQLPNYGTKQAKFFKRSVSQEHRDRIGNPSSLLNLQADFLYPNALASVIASHVDVDNVERDPLRLSVDREAAGPSRGAVGCKGNQLDQEFPFESRTPVALPLLQYPTPTNNQLVTEEHDACALPVLNWEKYIQELNGSIPSINKVQPLGGSKTRRPSKKPSSNALREHLMARRRLTYVYQKREQAERAKNHDEAVSDKSCGDDDHDEETDFSEDEREALRDSCNNRVQAKIRADVTKAVQNLVPDKVGKRKSKVREALAKVLFDNHNLDVEEDGPEQKQGQSKEISKEDETTLTKNIMMDDIYEGMQRSEKLSLSLLRKYTRQPKYKIQGTWNYLFNGHGACDWICDPHDKTRRHILVGHGTKLRVASVKPSKNTSMFSYTLDNVWEEENVPTNIKPRTTSPNEEVSDLILQIITARKGRVDNCLGAVRRGRSVEIYRFDESPSLVTSVANVFYGTNKYQGYKATEQRPVQGNPILVSCDLNPWFPEELTMLDENNILTFVDFANGRTVYQISPATEREGRAETKYPEFHLNEFSGVAYGNHPRTAYFWADSHIYFHDYRTDLSTKTNCVELFNLRYSSASRAWSEEFKFQDDYRHLVEAVSAVKRCSFPSSTYYHVGTTSRVLLMDMRVPGNPVLRMDHGLKSPAAYLDSCHDDNYEVVIAGSQRFPETFCAIHDHAHVSCAERADCTARNPVLHSCPKHLSNSTQFFEFAETHGISPSWENDNARAKSHCYAWSTGISMMKLPHKMNSAKLPAGFAVFHGNSFGDIFYQEWDQRQTGNKTTASNRRLKVFLNDWKLAMSSKNPQEYHQESQAIQQPANCTLIVEVNSDIMKTNAKARQNPFSSFEVTQRHDYVSRLLAPLADQITKVRRLGTEFEDQLLSVWEPVPESDEVGAQEQEEQEGVIKEVPEDYLSSLSGTPRNLTDDERRVLAELKHEHEAWVDELLEVDESEVCVIDEIVGATGFQLMEVDDEHFHASRNDEEQLEDELSRELYPSVANRFQTEPEVIIPDSAEAEWQELAISEENSSDNQPIDPDPDAVDEAEIPAPRPIPLKINPEMLEQEILGMCQLEESDALPPHSSLQQMQQDDWISPQTQLTQSEPGSASLFRHFESQGVEFEDYAVDDERYFEATYEPMKYDQGAPNYDEGALDPESEALSAHFSGASRRT